MDVSKGRNSAIKLGGHVFQQVFDQIGEPAIALQPLNVARNERLAGPIQKQPRDVVDPLQDRFVVGIGDAQIRFVCDKRLYRVSTAELNFDDMLDTEEDFIAADLATDSFSFTKGFYEGKQFDSNDMPASIRAACILLQPNLAKSIQFNVERLHRAELHFALRARV